MVTADARSRDALRLDLEAFLGRPALVFPAWPRGEPTSAPDPDVLLARVTALEALAAARRGEGPAPVVVGALDAYVQEVPSPEVTEASHVRFAPGQQRPLEVIQEHLASTGYTRRASVDAPGEFAARGGLLDLWPWGRPEPVRLDFFDDELESIRELDPGTQRSGAHLEELDVVALPPVRFREPQAESAATFLTAHLPEGARVALVEREALIGVATSLRSAGDRADTSRVRRLEKALGRAPSVMLAAQPLGSQVDLDLEATSIDALRGIALRGGGEDDSPADRAERIGRGFADLARRADRVVVHRRAAGEEERLVELFEAYAPALRVAYAPGSLTRSFVLGRVAHVAYDDLADLPLRERRPDLKAPRSRPIESFLELERGGLVVHLTHGIGIYRGLESMDAGDGPGEYLRIEFAEGTTVFVPVARIDLVQRYVGAGRLPRLSKIGGVEWSNRKKKVTAAVEALAEDLLETQAHRARRTGPPLPPDTEWQREFEAAFPHDDTPDQTTSTRAIKADLESDQPMDRLLCGDVGYGKTEVALRAIFKVVTNHRQAAILVPTKILAEQHARVFLQRLAPYPVRVRVLSGLKSAAENREVIAGLKDGSVDVCVGTHRLLSKDVAFKDLGLLVVDEEQRFGVKHKERLKRLRAEVDILTLSATPIPRTLHMALLGIRDISNLTTPPLGRHPIETRVAAEDDAIITEAIRRELGRGGQVFLVSSRIRDLPVLAGRLAELVPEARTAWIHGQMEKDTIERRLMRFVRGDADVLLATTIIESGLDIPNANTIIIRDADRYGLAELHQLRGRVGRERRRAYALILLPSNRRVNPEATERLRAIEEYSELGAGFQIAMRDLEIRGAGNLLGPQQSGHIAAVGYDLYCKLLADAVASAQGKAPPGPPLAALTLEVPGGLPDAYVADEREKFRLFRRVAATESGAALDELRAELADRFGTPPAETLRLLLSQRVRIRAGRVGLVRVAAGPEKTPGALVDGSEAAFARLTEAGVEVRLLSETRAFLPTPGAVGPEAILEALLDRLPRA